MRMPPNCQPAGLVVAASMEGGMTHAAESLTDLIRLNTRASMEGGMRMPPNSSAHVIVHSAPFGLASMEGGMRMPPNLERLVASCGLSARFNGGRHAHAAECLAAVPNPTCLPLRGCACRRTSLAVPRRSSPAASMEGGMRMPPNHRVREAVGELPGVNAASMEGGMRMPPNHVSGPPPRRRCRLHASMEGGMRMPPNGPDGDGVSVSVLQWRAACACRIVSVQGLNTPMRFNGGRHAHAAE